MTGLSDLSLGIITYDHPHLKTDQVVSRLLAQHRFQNVVLFTLPFTPRPARPVLFNHRPDQSTGRDPAGLAGAYGLAVEPWDGKAPIGPMDNYVITGAGLIDPALALGGPVLNAHPGLIPTARGLDAFKWAIHDGLPLGITLHEIDAAVDSGTVRAYARTPVRADDSLADLAARHYENEITLLADFPRHLHNRPKAHLPANAPRKRMGRATEKEMITRFPGYREKYITTGTEPHQP
ncbi:formyltransferase family protein [Yunchengibacter salinarum]|uniref:formyltransferase family protein n=1 Tax=Yunchengibacter salinarum TaxID=3133399 RepID=UPI0035B69607